MRGCDGELTGMLSYGFLSYRFPWELGKHIIAFY